MNPSQFTRLVKSSHARRWISPCRRPQQRAEPEVSRKKAVELVLAALTRLADDPKVLFAKLLDRKDTLVHSSLWPALLAVGSAREPWQIQGLSAAAADLLKRVDRGNTEVRSTGLIAKELQIRLLATAHEVHTDSGRHELLLESWSAWSERVGCKPLKSSADGRQILEQATVGLGAPLKALPWPARS